MHLASGDGMMARISELEATVEAQRRSHALELERAREEERAAVAQELQRLEHYLEILELHHPEVCTASLYVCVDFVACK